MKHIAPVLAFVFAACGATRNDDLSDGVIELPKALREVSGITMAPDGRVACLQDELGVIHLVDPDGLRPAEAVPFGERGDYEGLARVGADYWVLRSDGYLARITTEPGRWHISASLRLPSGREWESLCYDAAAARLLTVQKGPAVDDGKADDLRPVWAIDPQALTIATEPLLTLRRRRLVDDAEAQGIALAKQRDNQRDKGKNRTRLELLISEMLVVPVSGHLLLLSAQDGLVLRVDRDGRLHGASVLDRETMPQAEGMTLLPDGRLLVATEGRGAPARLVVVALP
ncbi:MAG: SdiA-regulated domain-containing protein [Planctomycetota bacterium]